jgi:hypothetical protein
MLGRPFLDWKLEQLAAAGATDLHLLVAHRQDEVRDWIGDVYADLPVTYHVDSGDGRRAAHRTADLPPVHWLTYGDCLLDVPLEHRPFPYRWANTEFRDAGVAYCWGRNERCASRWTASRSHHINDSAAYAECESFLKRAGAHASSSSIVD